MCGMTPLCVACAFAPTVVTVALLDGGADIDFVTQSTSSYPGFTPLMYAVLIHNTGVAKLFLKRGADGTKRVDQTTRNDLAGSTALDIARAQARDSHPACVETFAVLRKRCCSTCGKTSPGLAARTAGEQKHLKRCGNYPARGSRARYCNEQCQRADWVPRHRSECAEARRAQQAAGTEV
jgi:hypothetical protein